MALKFSDNVLLEIVDVVRIGLTRGIDISQNLRDIEVILDEEQNKIELSPEYLKKTRR